MHLNVKRFGASFLKEPSGGPLKFNSKLVISWVYQDKFESLLNKLELLESYAVSLFVGGLKDEISMPIRMFKLTNLGGFLREWIELKNTTHWLCLTVRIVMEQDLATSVVDKCGFFGSNRRRKRVYERKQNSLVLMQLSLGSILFNNEGERSAKRCEMVLGVQWLATLGDIKWNFKNLTMEFELLALEKEAMMEALVLGLPDFDQEFVVETDASGTGIGASLKYLLNQKLTTPFQLKWLPKLLGYDYEIVFKKGVDNAAADALSRVNQGAELLQTVVSSVSSDVMNQIKGKTVIMVVVDRLSKYAHFMPLSHPFNASQVAQVFLDGVYKLHGLPKSIVSDRDKVFLSTFWKSLFSSLQVKLKLSTAYHPQTDGQTEVVNKCLGCYLRCMCGEKPKRGGVKKGLERWDGKIMANKPGQIRNLSKDLGLLGEKFQPHRRSVMEKDIKWGKFAKLKEGWIVGPACDPFRSHHFLSDLRVSGKILTNSVTPVVTMDALQETMNEIKSALLTLTGQVNDHIVQFRVFQTELTRLSNGEGTSGGNNDRNSNGRQGNNQMVQYGRMSKIEFPKFNGDDVKGWIFRCRQFFRIDHVPEEMKVELAAMHVYDKALAWHQQLIKRYGEGCTWELYEQEALKRFGAVFEDPMVDLKNLKQTSTVQVYQDQFESLLNKLELLESYAVSLFVGGLKDEISMPIRMFKLTTLADAFSMARMQEATNNAMKPRYNPSSSNFKFNNVGGGYKGNGLIPKPTTTPLALPAPAQNSNGARVPNTLFRKQLTQKELEEKRAKNQCFYCDQRYSPGHKCSGQVYSLEVIGESEEYEEEVIEQLVEANEEEENVEMCNAVFDNSGQDTPRISLNALSGVNSFQTMRVRGMVGKQPLHILVDSGSTHNFVDVRSAKRLGCKIRPTAPLLVSVANGQDIVSSYECKPFNWSIQGQDYSCDAMLLPLGGCEMVLGVQWLATLGDIKWNFKNLTMEFELFGKRILLRGTRQTTLQWMQGKNVQTRSKNKEAELYSLMLVPTELPPQRTHDHKIPLVPNTPPINIRPYRHPPSQKDAIEVMVKELMDSGVIRASQSSFSSPIVMVKKKDGTWRMCVDYRQLNKYTVKDKFPIPVIEELMDELGGSAVFSKLDLRSSYHQIRMSEEDIEKTAFRTHEGHYEFLVMPFGLTNAPSTFQSLMNTVFKPFLRKFTLVFFDDILVYSKTVEEHCVHLKQVLEVMRYNKLFAKQSKCSFAVKKVEYLGHVITGEGVATDPSKIEAIKNWPVPSNLKQLRGFLGLTGYYRRFIKRYAMVSQPLTALLKKNSFQWSNVAEVAFEHLKRAMMEASVLRLPDFDQEFVVETDASGTGIGAVLCQNGHPLAYLSKTLAIKHQALSTYEKEFMAVVAALEKWKGYLLDRHFKIKTDHFSLKYLLNQKLTTPFQLKWLPKLLGYDYEIVFKKGVDNAAADALSRVNQGAELLQTVVSSVSSDVMNQIKVSWQNDDTMQQLIKSLKDNSYKGNKLSLEGDLLKRKGKIMVGNEVELRKQLIAYFHESVVGGHSGVLVTTKKLSVVFYWKGLKRMVRQFVKNVITCQRQEPYPNPNLVVCNPYLYLKEFGLRVESVDKTCREEIVKMLQFHMKRAQDRMENQANKHRTNREFEVGTWVYLKLQPHRQVTVRQGQQHKLSAKYYGPFMIEERVGKVAYKLQLPSYSQIHPVFHISQLKKCHGKTYQMGSLPQLKEDGLLDYKPMAILERRLGKVNNKPVMYVLIQWTNRTVEEATWEIYADVLARFPDFDAA
ncbi:retrotransposon-related protein [Tanacetum coccineum]